MENKERSKRIAKNTIILYFRLILILGISLFTSRVILQVLGIDDYGVYNVVGGVVSMFSFFSASLSAAISRYITFELGNNNMQKLKDVFNTSLSIQIGFAIVIAIIIEIVGGWLLNYKLNIPANRIIAANWVLNCAILSFFINLISVPYNATIIAHERMKVFAYISIIEVILKLLIVYALKISPIDKLKLYALLMVGVSLIIRLIYGFYCSRNFKECKYNFTFNKKLFKEMSTFAGWNLFGTGAYLLNTQGINIITNIFFGVSVNAARGIASQVDGSIKQFVTNFTTAINPQITKSYAAGDKTYMFLLVCRGAKYSYLLLLIFAVPFILESDFILKAWLGNVPSHTSIFLKLIIIGSLADVLGNSSANAAWATGNIKRYYLYVGSIGCLPFPISYILFYMGYDASSSYLAFIVIYIILVFVKLYILKGLLNFPVIKFFKDVILRIIPITLLSFIVPVFLCRLMDESFYRLCLVGMTGGVSILLLTYMIGLSHDEKSFVSKKIKYSLR